MEGRYDKILTLIGSYDTIHHNFFSESVSPYFTNFEIVLENIQKQAQGQCSQIQSSTKIGEKRVITGNSRGASLEI